MEISEDFAELYGALLGDGCLSKYNRKDRTNPTYCTVFTGHTHDWPYYQNTLRPILIKLYGVEGGIRKRKGENTIDLVTTTRRVFESLKTLGIPVGVKSNLRMPEKIYNSNKLAICCVRGVFDTDGSVYNRYSKQYSNHAKHYHYKVVQIKMKEPVLLKQIKEVLERNCIKTTRITLNGGASVLRITEQKSVEHFFNLVKPSNTYHTERYLNRLEPLLIRGP